jgi:hypothetical protein
MKARDDFSTAKHRVLNVTVQARAKGLSLRLES